MKILMTGAAGFIGGHAYDHFVSRGDEVLVVDKFSYAANPLAKNKIKNLIEIDVSDKDLLPLVKDYRPNYIVHFAAETHVDNSINDSYDFVVSNILGTTNILDACRSYKIKLCHVSTDEVYGPASDKAFTEEDHLNPMNPYSATKAAADLMIKAYRNTHKIDYVIVRPSNNYGPGQNKEKFIPKLMDCIINKKKFPLYGTGDQKREWTFVADTGTTIRQIILAEKNWCSTYNISSGIMYSNFEVIKKVLKTYKNLTGTEIQVLDLIESVADRPGHDKKYWISTNKLDSLVKIDYTNFESGIEQTVASYVK